MFFEDIFTLISFPYLFTKLYCRSPFWLLLPICCWFFIFEELIICVLAPPLFDGDRELWPIVDSVTIGCSFLREGSYRLLPPYFALDCRPPNIGCMFPV